MRGTGATEIPRPTNMLAVGIFSAFHIRGFSWLYGRSGLKGTGSRELILGEGVSGFRVLRKTPSNGCVTTYFQPSRSLSTVSTSLTSSKPRILTGFI